MFAHSLTATADNASNQATFPIQQNTTATTQIPELHLHLQHPPHLFPGEVPITIPSSTPANAFTLGLPMQLN